MVLNIFVIVIEDTSQHNLFLYIYLKIRISQSEAFHHLHFPQTTINVSQCSNVHPRLVSGRWLVRRFFSFSPWRSSTLPKPPPAKETIAQLVI